jgi:hypothetical protein
MTSRGAFRSPLILFLLAGGVLGQSQSVTATAPPPAGLPQMLFQCDLAQGLMTCALWIWNGKLYDGAWANGTIGQMTVQSPDPHALVIKRIDTTGAAAGLNGTYSGKWDGKQITDAKFSWSWKDKSTVFAWSASPAVVPVTLVHVNPGNATNWYSAPLTAYTILGETGIYRGISIVDYRSRGELPMQKFETRAMPLDCPQTCGADKPSAVAAVYADGAAFGDEKAIAAIMSERSLEERTYKAIALKMCALAKQQLGTAEIVSALANVFDAPPSAEGAEAARAKALRFAAKFLNLRATLGPDGKVTIQRGTPISRPHSQSDTDNTVEATLKEMNDRRTLLLADPVRDKAGKLYLIDAPDDVECKLR